MVHFSALAGEVERGDITKLYLMSFYWTILAMTTVGNLPHPTTKVRRAGVLYGWCTFRTKWFGLFILLLRIPLPIFLSRSHLKFDTLPFLSPT